MEFVLLMLIIIGTPLVIGFGLGVWYQQYEINKKFWQDEKIRKGIR